MNCLAFLTFIAGVATTYGSIALAEEVRLIEVQAENPRRYALLVDGDMEPNWRATGATYCAFKSDAPEGSTIWYQVRAEAPVRFAWFREGQTGANWERTGNRIYTPPEGFDNSVTLAEYRAEGPVRFAFFTAGEANWSPTGLKMTLLQCE